MNSCLENPAEQRPALSLPQAGFETCLTAQSPFSKKPFFSQNAFFLQGRWAESAQEEEVALPLTKEKKQHQNISYMLREWL